MAPRLKLWLGLALISTLAVLGAPVASTDAPTRALQCEDGERYDAQSPEPRCVRCAKASWCPSGRADHALCRSGHRGAACGECEDNYFFSAKGRCHECPPISSITLAWVGASVSCVLLAVAVYLNAANWMDSAAVTIVTTHFQLSYVYFSFGFAIPKIVTAFSRPLGALFGFGFILDIAEGWAAPGCMGLASLPYSVWWVMKMAVPFLFMAPFIAIVAVAESKQLRWRKSDEAKNPRNRILSVVGYEERSAARLVSKRAVQSILLICISALMSGVQSSVNIWTCMDFADGSQRLAEDPTVICTGSNPIYRSLVLASILVFSFYYFSISGFLAIIIEREEGRRAAAEHYITHARSVAV